jgi:nicotinate-nucleotide adenylyltransferase
LLLLWLSHENPHFLRCLAIEGFTRLIGIVGGTFDPIHNGHLCPVFGLSKDILFDRVHYVLSARPPHRTAPSASIHHRYRMLELALEPYLLFEADDQEIHRPGPSFTLWTLRRLRQQYEDHSLCLILGLDAYLGIHKWYRWPDIASMANIIVLTRPGWKLPDGVDGGDAQQIAAHTSGAVMFWNSLEMPIASTDIRRCIGNGEDTGRQMPPAVLNYIYANDIYGANSL